MNTITPLTGAAVVGSSTSRFGGQENQLLMKQGQVVKASVLEAKSAEIFILDIKGTRVAARAQTPLTVGQTLQLQVATTTPHIELRIVNEPANIFLGKSITLLGNGIDINPLLASLKNITPSPLDSLTSSSRQTIEAFYNFGPTAFSGQGNGNILQQFINRLGLSLEALLARGDRDTSKSTLKAALLEMVEVFKNAEALTEKSSQLLNTIELYQLAQLQLGKENLLIFPLPLSFLLKGYLILDYSPENEKKAGAEEVRKYSLHLALTELGNLRIDFLKKQDGVYIRFISDSQEKLSFIENYKNELLQSMHQVPLAGITFVIEKVDPSTDLLKRLLPNGESLVNTTA